MHTTSLKTCPNPMRLLLVEDDQPVRAALTEMLQADGHHVMSADSGHAGVGMFAAAMAHEPFDAVVTDLCMPGTGGREVAACVKELSPRTPVVLLSGWGQLLKSSGMTPPNIDVVITKPARMARLREALWHCDAMRHMALPV